MGLFKFLKEKFAKLRGNKNNENINDSNLDSLPTQNNENTEEILDNKVATENLQENINNENNNVSENKEIIISKENTLIDETKKEDETKIEIQSDDISIKEESIEIHNEEVPSFISQISEENIDSELSEEVSQNQEAGNEEIEKLPVEEVEENKEVSIEEPQIEDNDERKNNLQDENPSIKNLNEEEINETTINSSLEETNDIVEAQNEIINKPGNFENLNQLNTDSIIDIKDEIKEENDKSFKNNNVEVTTTSDKYSKKEKEDVDSYSKGLSKSREAFASRFKKLARKFKHVNEEYFNELEEILIEADVGVELTLKTIEEITVECKTKHIKNADDINEMVVDKLFEGYMSKGYFENDIKFSNNGPTVLLVCGVNGVGKTTTIAKLANRYIKQGKKVMLCAADTFRAGAIEQLQVWGERLGCEVIVGKVNSDPASVAFEGAKQANLKHVDLLIVDTAGRLQNKINLMNELEKISRVISKEIPSAPHDAFLIIDATTGQNGVIQAKQFLDCIKLTGIVITKMDGTSKGGIILAIRDTLGIPVRFIGLGEKMDDLKEFNIEKYLYGLVIGDEDE